MKKITFFLLFFFFCGGGVVTAQEVYPLDEEQLLLKAICDIAQEPCLEKTLTEKEYLVFFFNEIIIAMKKGDNTSYIAMTYEKKEPSETQIAELVACLMGTYTQKPPMGTHPKKPPIKINKPPTPKKGGM